MRGYALARIEMEVMVDADVSIDAGEPTYNTNAGLYGFTGLPLRMSSGGR